MSPPLPTSVPVDSRSLATLRQGLSVGTSRAALPPLPPPLDLFGAGGEAQDLVTLALTAMARRFMRPLPPARSEGALPRRLPAPDLLPIGPMVRRCLDRVARQGDMTTRSLLFGAALDRIALAGFGLHPFDLPVLEPLLRQHRDRIGGLGRAYLDVVDGKSSPAESSERPTRETWRQFGKPERLAFLEALRKQDPDAARSLLETDFGRDPAALRADLLRVMAIRLDEADRAFLEIAAGDRAEAVRKIASTLLGRLRSSPVYAERIAAFVARLGVQHAPHPGASPQGPHDGALLRRQLLTWKPTDEAKTVPLLAFCRDLVDGLRLGDVEAAMAVAGTSLADATIGDTWLAACLIRMAMFEGQDAKALRIAGNCREPDGAIFAQMIADLFTAVAARDRVRPLSAFVATGPAALLLPDTDLGALAQTLRAPLPDDLAQTLVDDAAFDRAMADCALPARERMYHVAHARLLPLAILLPASVGGRFRQSLSNIEGGTALAAAVFTDFGMALAADTTDTN